jgi:hypothetical protein
LVVACAAASCKLAHTAPPPDTCPDWGCGGNAASMGKRLIFHELDLCGQQANSAGVKLEKVLGGPDHKPLFMRVEGGDQLVGVDPGQQTYRGKDLLGAVMVLTTPLERFDVRISQVGQTPFWVDPSASGPAPTYTFEWRQQGGPEQFVPLCAGLPSHEWDDKKLGKTLAVVFMGDRYNAAKKTVDVSPTECWVTIACAGSSPAKMHLLRHTQASSIPGKYETTVDQRQTMLKMLTDDICGTGKTFTVDGENVRYMDRGGWHPFTPRDISTVEAIWGPQGAFCLDEPRRLKEMGPDLWKEIDAECPRPKSCRKQGYDMSNWTTRSPSAYGISGNP